MHTATATFPRGNLLHIDLPFDAALILEETALKVDKPELWTRYLNNRVIRYGRFNGARMAAIVGPADLVVIRDYFVLWLDDRIEPDHRQTRLAENAVHLLSGMLNDHAKITPCR